MAGIKIASVIDGIAALTPTGVSILDSDEIPSEANARSGMMFLDPSQPFTNFKFDPQAFGNDATSMKANVNYTLNYVYCHSPVGSGRGIYSEVPDMIGKVVLILQAIAADFDVNGIAVDITPRIEGENGQVQDPAGNLFWGCLISLDVLEFYEV